MLQRDLVREGRFDPEAARLLSRLQKFRSDADYTAEYVFTEAAATAEVAAARAFIAAARTLLLQGAWLDEP